MTKGPKKMYDIAYAKAVEKGPRIVTLKDGKKVSVYCLSKTELRSEVFGVNDFNIRGQTWLEWINTWKEEHGDRAPSKAVILSPGSADWTYIFMGVDKDDLIDLRMFAEDNGAPSLTTETKQTLLTGVYS